MGRLAALTCSAAGGYILGMLPSADIAASLAGERNLRELGTQNPGAANALEVLGKPWAVGIAIADVAKGYVAGHLGRSLAGPVGANLAASAAVIGHCYPATANFRGGKGVATSVGQVLATQPAYLVLDAAAMAGASKLVSSPHKARKSTVVTAALWVCMTSFWSAFGWRNPGGPPIHVSHVVAAAVSSTVIVTRFLSEETP